LFKALGINIMIKSVDASQGKEKSFVILDMVTPGATQYTMGFLKDLRRINVALSRAEDGLPSTT
jgi:superfamily I DNA and/or RNA helicase